MANQRILTGPYGSITPRKDQHEAIDLALREYDAAKGLALMVAAPGWGKTSMSACLISQVISEGGRVLIGVNGRELANQWLDRLRAACPGVSYSVIGCGRLDTRKGRGPDWSGQYVLASVQALARIAPEELTEQGFDLVILDEAHHSPAPTWKDIIEAVVPRARLVLGITGSPLRGDDAHSVVDLYGGRIIYQVTLREAIRRGHLCPAEGYRVNSGIDLGRLRAHLAEICRDPDRRIKGLKKVFGREILAALEAYLRYADRQWNTVVACRGVHHARRVARAFQVVGIRADALHCGLDDARGAQYVARCRDLSQPHVLTNLAIINEAFDAPQIKNVIILRRYTTVSAVVGVLQLIGRGMRLYPGATRAIVIEVVDLAPLKYVATLPAMAGKHATATSDSVLGKELGIEGDSGIVSPETIAKEEARDEAGIRARAKRARRKIVKCRDIRRYLSPKRLEGTDVCKFDPVELAELLAGSRTLDGLTRRDTRGIMYLGVGSRLYTLVADSATGTDEIVEIWTADGLLHASLVAHDEIRYLGTATSFDALSDVLELRLEALNRRVVLVQVTEDIDVEGARKPARRAHPGAVPVRAPHPTPQLPNQRREEPDETPVTDGPGETVTSDRNVRAMPEIAADEVAPESVREHRAAADPDPQVVDWMEIVREAVMDVELKNQERRTRLVHEAVMESEAKNHERRARLGDAPFP